MVIVVKATGNFRRRGMFRITQYPVDGEVIVMGPNKPCGC